MGAKPKAQTVGFRYSFDIHGALAKAIDGLLQIRASGKVAWSGNATSSQTISINAPNLFGGDKGEGGIQGQFDLMMGDEAQPLNTRLAAALGGGLVPNFRGFAGFFYSGLVTSINPYPKKWETLSYRRLAGWDGPVWYPETCAIDLAGGAVRAMNPAHILYETYTNRENGRGLDRSMLDDAAWRAAALKLYNEGFGLCIGWKRSQGTAFGADTTAHLVAMPAVVDPGDLLLMHFVNDGNATVATPADWTLLNTTLSGTQVRSSWYWKLAAGTEDGTTVDLVTSAAEHAAAQVHRFQAGTFDAAAAPAIAVATGTSVSPNPPNLAPSWGIADTYWIAAYGADDDDATTGWPWTEGQTYTPSGTGTVTCSAGSCVLALRVANIDPATFTMAASEEWVAATVAIKPA